jgi:Homeodomain-like domain
MRLLAKHWKAIYLLAEGKSQTETARILETSNRTIKNWINDKDFIEALNEVERIKRIQLREALGVATIKAVDKLIEILDNPNSRDRDKLQAASILMTFGVKAWLPPQSDREEQTTLGFDNGIVANSHYTTIAPQNVFE